MPACCPAWYSVDPFATRRWTAAIPQPHNRILVGGMDAVMAPPVQPWPMDKPMANTPTKCLAGIVLLTLSLAATAQPGVDPLRSTTDRRASYDWWALQPLAR